MIEARVKEQSPWRTINAFSGRQYTRGEWQRVPDDVPSQKEARRRMVDEKELYLEFREDLPAEAEDAVIVPAEVVLPEPEAKPEITEGALALIRDRGLNPADIIGTGLGGRIIKSDVERVLRALAPDEEE